MHRQGVFLQAFVSAMAVFCFLSCGSKDADKVKIVAKDPVEAPKESPGAVKVGDDDGADVTPFGEEGDALSPEDKAKLVRHLRSVRPKPGETLAQYSQWSGIAEEELKLLNKNNRPVFGTDYKLMLSELELEEFKSTRREHWNQRMMDYLADFEVGTKKHKVKSGDTLSGIARKHKIDLWLLVEFNEKVLPPKPENLAAGNVLEIPVLIEKKKSAQEGFGAETSPEAHGLDEEAGIQGETEEGFVVIVKAGERLSLYKEWSGESDLIERIVKANPSLKNPDNIVEGQKLKVPIREESIRNFNKKRKKYHDRKNRKH